MRRSRRSRRQRVLPAASALVRSGCIRRVAYRPRSWTRPAAPAPRSAACIRCAPVVGALLERCLDLDADYGDGILYELLVIYESQRFGGSPETAREYYRRALELSRETRASTWLLWAENFSVPDQNVVEFKDLLNKVLAFDVDKYPKDRLLNILAQRRARWLMGRVDELFLEGDDL